MKFIIFLDNTSNAIKISISVTLYDGLPEKGINLIRYYSKQTRGTQSKMIKFVVIVVINFSFIFLEATAAAVVVYKRFSNRQQKFNAKTEKKKIH
jgi:hypothetical protein